MSDKIAWVEINLDNLSFNVRTIKKHIGEKVEIMAVVKADAYGHGVCKVSEVLYSEGIRNFAVATYREAIELREKFRDISILILGYSPIDIIDKIIENNLEQMVQSYDYAEQMDKTAKKLSKTALVHINFDTGMTRFGFTTEKNELESAKKVFSLENLEVKGIMTHFTSSDMPDEDVSLKQMFLFEKALDYLKESGIALPAIHVENSGATMRFFKYRFNMVRMGLVAYGLKPSNIKEFNDFKLKPVMSLKATAVRVKNFDKGTAVGYTGAYVLLKEETIVTLPIGYADGLTRLVDNKYGVLFKGERHPVAGNICMGAMMISLKEGFSAKIGDVFTFFGQDGEKFVPIEELSSAMGIIPYELICRMKMRLQRVYTYNVVK